MKEISIVYRTKSGINLLYIEKEDRYFSTDFKVVENSLREDLNSEDLEVVCNAYYLGKALERAGIVKIC